MAISVTWATRVIFVPKADLTPVSGSLFELDLNAFRLALKDLEDSPAGMPNPDTHRHNTEVTLGGVTYARTIEIINGYTVEFEDDGTPDGHYTVRCVGANHNLSDVKVLNSVSLIIGNAAGLIVRDSAGLTEAAQENLALLRKVHTNRFVTDPATGKLRVYDDDDVTVALEADIYQDAQGVTPYQGSGLERRDKAVTP